MTSIQIKFNNIRDLSDARYAAAAMAEWVGFTVGKHDSLSPQQIQEIIGWCSGPKLILELDPGVEVNTVLSMLDVLPVDGLEVEKSLLDKLNLPTGIELILLGEPTDAYLTHSITPHSNNHICNVSQSLTADFVNSHNLQHISLDCFSSANPALKDYDNLTVFLEELGCF